MENSQQKKMKEEKPSTSSSKSLIRSNSQGLKIPKILLVKSMQKRNQKSNTEDFEADKIKNKKKRWGRLPRNLFPKKMGSIICHVFGKQKSAEPKILKSHSLKEILEIEDNEKKREKTCCAKSLQLLRDENKQSLKVMGVNCRKVKRVRSVKNRVKQSEGKLETGEGKEGGNEKEKETKKDEELCKKRILMGGKCRPLNVSGVLHYDQDGILLPEDVFP